MERYLTFITTVLVLTQVIRVTQNAIQLHRQNAKLDEQYAWLKDNEVTEEDFRIQRDVFKMLKKRLEES